MAGIYVHVPFCHAKCAYCDFYSLADRRRSGEYVEAVVREYARRKSELAEEPVRTLYFGGGTPSVLSENEFASLARVLNVPEVEEFTIEVNPEDVTEAKVEAWKRAGVNRVSMGVQSLVDEELKAVNRRHSAREALEAIALLKRHGISNISCDLIYGLPGQTLESWEYSLRKLLDAGITHLSAYNLMYEEGTLLTMRLRKGLIQEADEELIEAMYTRLCNIAGEYGFEHYEISNFATPGHCSRHNSAYWDGTPYLGLGPGAHSLDSAGVRRFAPSDLRAFLSDPENAAIVDAEDDTDRINDRIFTALRTSRGLAVEDVPGESRAVVDKYLSEGLMVRRGDRVAIPEEHFLISDAIIREIFV